ncbi:glycosyltransferase [Candidatus Woesearchaeota archaeon]|nr:glycosyltransferase [Candidatus Woesearchaeota archaeon]
MKSVDIVIPIYYNNIDEIEPSVREQIDFYKKNLKEYRWKIVIGINGLDKNGIVEKVEDLSKRYENVAYDYTDQAGRGASLNRTFVNSKADFVCYMDVDLATGLDAVPRMLKELEYYEVVVGSKYIKDAKYNRTPLRFVLSKIYNLIITKLILNAKFSDAQCGFKGMHTLIAREIMPLVEDKGWFLDTEILYIVQKKGYKFKEIPVHWIERENSGVKLLKTVKDFTVKTIRLRYRNL